MVEATEKQKRRANVSALVTVVFVTMFAMAFIGVITMLNNYADSLEDIEEEIEVGTEAPTDPFYVLLIGSDSRKGTAMYTGKAGDDGQFADIMTLMRIDPPTYTITLVTIPRDTVVDEGADKVNAALNEGNDPLQVVEEVGRLTGVYADHYMMTTFISFENLINALGGIDVNVPATITVSDPANGKSVKVKAGKNQHLNGSEALVLARARKEYGDNQDALRQVNVRNIERAIIDKVLAMDGSFDVEHVLAVVEDDTKTDMDLPSTGLLMLGFVEHADEVTIYDCTGPYAGDQRKSDGQWVIPGDDEKWAELMQVVDAGEDPSRVVKAPKF